MNYYDEIAEGYNELYGEEQLNKLKEVEKIVSFKKNYLILDIGCGTGILTSKIAKNAKLVVGTDVSKKMILKAKKKKNVFYIIADAEHLPFKQKTFDIIVSFSAIQNVSNPKKMIKEAKKVGKKVAITVPMKLWKKEKITSLGQFNIIKGQKDWIFTCICT